MKSFEQRVSEHYPNLSEKLREAANFIIENPIDTATRSLRSLSKEAKLAPVTFTRLSRATGYENYEQLREVMRASVARQRDAFSPGVTRLQEEYRAGDQSFSRGHLQACVNNIGELAGNIDTKTLDHVVDVLHQSKHVLVCGALGSAGIAEQLIYMASFVSNNWNSVSREGSSLGSNLVGLSVDDALIVITKSPFANSSLEAVNRAQTQGAFVFVISDSPSCPAIAKASASLIVPTTTPHYFSSYVATLAVVESLVGLLAAKAGEIAQERISQIEAINRQLEYSQ